MNQGVEKNRNMGRIPGRSLRWDPIKLEGRNRPEAGKGDCVIKNERPKAWQIAHWHENSQETLVD